MAQRRGWGGLENHRPPAREDGHCEKAEAVAARSHAPALAAFHCPQGEPAAALALATTPSPGLRVPNHCGARARPASTERGAIPAQHQGVTSGLLTRRALKID